MNRDLAATAVAIALFGVIAFVPGYAIAWIADLFEFRARSFRCRAAVAVALSTALTPIATYLLWRCSLIAVWAMYAVLFGGFLVAATQRRTDFGRITLSRTGKLLLAVAAAWFAVGTFSLIDLQIGEKLYFPVVSYDNTLRTAVTAAISRTGVPPQNPYFFAGHSFALRYHYFWFLLCSLVDQAGGIAVTPRHAIIAGTIWTGIALMATIALYMRFFQRKGPVDLERRVLIAVALLSVTGLDILPVGIIAAVTGRLMPTGEGWNGAVMAWVTSVIWSPHQVAGLIACLTGFLVIWRADACRRAPIRTLLVIGVAGLSFASAVGLSIYVSFAFVVFMALWVAVTAMKQQWRMVAISCGAALAALAACTPFLLELQTGQPTGGNAQGAVLQFGVLPFRFIQLAFANSAGSAQPWWLPLLYLAFLPLNYFLELGFFFAILNIKWKQIRREASTEVCAALMAGTSILVSVFISSHVISANDLTRRAILPAQFVLLLWAAELWTSGGLAPARIAPGVRVACSRSMWLLVCVGVAGSAYELGMVRWFPIISDQITGSKFAFLAADQHLGDRTYCLRQAYEYLNRVLPPSAVVQQNPHTDPGDLPYGLYADRQAAAESEGCGVAFGGDARLCQGVVSQLDKIFQNPGALQSASVDAMCRRLSISAVVVKDTDSVWADKSSWVWTKEPKLANGYARVFLFGPDPGIARDHQQVSLSLAPH